MVQQDYDEGQAPVEAGNPAGDDKPQGKTDFIDKVCDPCGLVPGNLDQAFAHKKKVAAVKTQEEEAAQNVVVETTPEETSGGTVAAAADSAVDSVLSTFDCCGKPALPAPTEEPEVKEVREGEQPEGTIKSDSDDSRSLAKIAANMDEIDLESALVEEGGDGDDALGGQISDDDGNSIAKLGKGQQEWYKQPLYAGLIVMSGAFSIAIFVLAILLIVN
mmetsp:Transcript_25674/g.56313  ORF Transcript_25674/g.56313 Transcript_25674/m.56313 type:complete len:218 (+) Transcript_25674:168-821(+)